MRLAEILNEDLRKWFKEKWVRFGPDGKIRGDCARGSDKEGKPKCLPQAKAHALGKKGRAKAAARKRREDPNPNRKGKAINVKTKENMYEAPIEMDPKDPMDPMIYGHDKANPGKLKYRMARAAGQLKDLAARVDNASPSEWQTMARQFEELKMNMEQIRHALEELSKIRKKGGVRSRGIDPMIDSIEEGWKSKIAGAALAAANLLGSPAQAADEPVKPITIATIMIDGEVRKYNLGDKFENAKEAEKFITNVLKKQGLQGYTLDIRHGYPKTKLPKPGDVSSYVGGPDDATKKIPDNSKSIPGSKSKMVNKMSDFESIEEGYGRYWCSTDKKWKERKGPKQKRSS